MNSINKTYRLTALLMALLMFTSSVGFSIDMHYCQNEFKSLSFFGKAKSCHEKAAKTPMKKGCMHHPKKETAKKTCGISPEKTQETKNCSMDEKDCCENKTLSFKADFDEQIPSSKFINNIPLQQFVAAYVTTFVVNDFDVESVTNTYPLYQTPLITRDIHVLVESFLL